MTDDGLRLFQSGDFMLHSGEVSNFKIDCDALTGDDWDALASWIAPTLPPFGNVIGVPTGGEAFAFALSPYITAGRTLLVDDVLTTGASMEAMRRPGMRGLVLFARRKPPSWIRAVFQAREDA